MPKSTKQLADLHEAEAMALLSEACGRKGKRQPASGAIWGHKGDGKISGVLRMEHKETGKDRYPLKHAELLKIEREAAGAEEPIMVLRFNDRFNCERFVIRRGEALPTADPRGYLNDNDLSCCELNDYNTENKQLTLTRGMLSTAMRKRGTIGVNFSNDKYRVISWEKYLEELRTTYLQKEQ